MLLHCLLCNLHLPMVVVAAFLTSQFIPEGVRVSAIVGVYLGVGIREEIEDSARILITCFK
jgi:hypothetical protein